MSDRASKRRRTTGYLASFFGNGECHGGESEVVDATDQEPVTAIDFVREASNATLGFNHGDLGLIERIHRKARITRTRFDCQSVQYTFAELPTLELAYCCTVRKSQGSEYRTVVMAVNCAHTVVLDRKLP